MLDAVSYPFYNPWIFWGAPLVFDLVWEGFRQFRLATTGGRHPATLMGSNSSIDETSS
jgi:hypothetical protein